ASHYRRVTGRTGGTQGPRLPLCQSLVDTVSSLALAGIASSETPADPFLGLLSAPPPPRAENAKNSERARERGTRKEARPTPMKVADRDLVDRARTGDTEAFGQLVRRHQQRIHRLAVHMLRDRAEAEDVTQETFIRAYQALARFDGRSEPYTWFYRITVNLSLNTIPPRKT